MFTVTSKGCFMPKHVVSYFKDENNSFSPLGPLLLGLLDLQEKEAVNYQRKKCKSRQGVLLEFG